MVSVCFVAGSRFGVPEVEPVKRAMLLQAEVTKVGGVPNIASVLCYRQAPVGKSDEFRQSWTHELNTVSLVH